MLSQIYLNKLKQFCGKLFFQCNFSDKYVDNIIQKNIFFKEILTAWCKENSTETIFSYANEPLRKNKHIKTGENTIMYIDWYNKGISYCKGIVNPNGKTLYTFANLKTKYHLSDNDFLKHLTLIHSISNKWKNDIKIKKNLKLRKSLH